MDISPPPFTTITGQAGPFAPNPPNNTLSVSAGRAYLHRFYTPRQLILTKMALILTTNAGGNDPIDVGIYDTSLARVSGNSAEGASTTLNGSLDASTTTVVVTSASGFPSSGNYGIRIDNENMLVTAGQGTTSWTVTRAQSGTTAATHANGATVYGGVLGKINSAAPVVKTVTIPSLTLTPNTAYYAAFSTNTPFLSTGAAVLSYNSTVEFWDRFGTGNGVRETLFQNTAHPLPATLTSGGPIAGVPVLVPRES